MIVHGIEWLIGIGLIVMLASVFKKKKYGIAVGITVLGLVAFSLFKSVEDEQNFATASNEEEVTHYENVTITEQFFVEILKQFSLESNKDNEKKIELEQFLE